MKALVCDKCGSTKLRAENGYMVCEYCETKFVGRGESQILTVKKESHIGISDDIARLIKKCETDPMNVKRYANRVLDIDPGNKEVLKYL